MTGHKYLARLNPLLEIDAAEAHDFADALIEMEMAWQIKPHPKTTAFFNLLLVSGAIYGPRILLIRAMSETSTKPKDGVETKPTADHVATAQTH